MLPVSYFRDTSRRGYAYDAASGVTTYHTGDIYEEVSQIFKGHVCISGSHMPEFSRNNASGVMHGIQYLSRADDLLVFSTGTKLDVIPLERALECLDSIKHAALVPNSTASGIVALIEPADFGTVRFLGSDVLPGSVAEDQWQAIQEGVAKINSMLPYEKRIPTADTDRIVLVDSLPVTTKLTLHRKKLKVILANNQGSWPLERRRHVIVRKPAPSELRVAPSPELDQIRKALIPLLASVFSLPIQDIQNPSFSLVSLGLTSISSVHLSGVLKEKFSVSIAQAALFGIRDINELAGVILKMSKPGEKHETLPKITPHINTPHPLQVPTTTSGADDIVITGASCSFPGGIRDLEDLWQALLMPKVHLEKIVQSSPPVSRWSGGEGGNKRPYDLETRLPMAYLSDDEYTVNASLAAFFGLKPIDVDAMPPNHRLVMMLGYRALEDAGVKPQNAEGGTSVEGESWAVFTSLNSSGWAERKLVEQDLNGKRFREDSP
jgi:acyl carrier protein